ncbi:peptide ABC superfamily ATP binding cassette transporter, binding protein [Lactobacillus selangorensis]|uniref:Peptide ABC superfamily ATP binding cassette transporter, binding protein n=1 Tax=Lactobacillus selangorensis TaxID=81857 RepID=A0A0R2GAR9_9LACO|nr:oligopeptide ABC transporter substrate-binding protein [Lactobacillus selangorensis]KRN29634.1 peptide ABC superfamily ATP binding cassette transporter, binding protein [Lactobacillus selangorensis]KRN33837.1 peptide ABC superfamily ATP binding cassette transporter, binding protein [Lactobacillus selangorensis]
MKKKRALGWLTLAATLTLSLAACGSKSSQSSSSTQKHFAETVSNKKQSVKGGTFTYGEVTDTPFKGIFEDTLQTDTPDQEVSQFGFEGLFKTDNNYKIVDGGAANLKLNQKAKTATITINKNVKWSDGVPVTAQDIVYAYRILGSKAAASQQYSSTLEDIVGMAEYHEGKSSTISGLEEPKGANGNEVVIHFKQMKPGMAYSGNGYFWESASPAHYYKNISMKKLISSPQVRKKPLFFGPYKVKSVVSGQSVEYVPNKYYYGKKPKLSKISVQVVSPDSVAAAIKNKKFDYVSVPTSQYKNVKSTKGVQFIGKQSLSYSYLGFKVGKYDSKTGTNVEDKNAKMNNKALRNAIAYGMNVSQVSKKFTDGLSYRGTTLIPTIFSKYHDSSEKGHPYDIKKAVKLLNNAGYKIDKKTGWRTQPNGKPLTIHLAAMSGASTQQPTVQNYLQIWRKKLHLNVKLTTGRLIEFNSFYDKLENDNKDVDMFLGAWSLSSEASPYQLYAAEAPFNFSRFNTKENTKLLNDIDSAKAFNNAYRVKAFKKWQAYMNKEAYVVPTTYSTDVYAVSSRVTGLSLKPSFSWANVGVSSK